MIPPVAFWESPSLSYRNIGDASLSELASKCGSMGVFHPEERKPKKRRERKNSVKNR